MMQSFRGVRDHGASAIRLPKELVHLNTVESRLCYVGLTLMAAVFFVDVVGGFMAISFGAPVRDGLVGITPEATAGGIAWLLRGPFARRLTEPTANVRNEALPLPILMSGALGVLGIYLFLHAGLLALGAWPGPDQGIQSRFGHVPTTIAVVQFVEFALGVFWVGYAMSVSRNYRRGTI